MLKKLIAIFYIFIFVFSFNQQEAQAATSGFVPGDIWYSKDPFAEGDKIKIYTFIFNSDKRELRGTVNFFDKDVLLGKKEFRISGESADDVFINWTATVGSHSIYAKIENAKFLTSKGTLEDAKLEDTETKSSSRTVSKKITEGKEDASTTENKDVNKESSTSLDGIQNTLEENLPSFISKPLVVLTSSLEDSRVSMHTSGEEKKEEIKNDLDTLKSESDTKDQNIFLKPFKYVQLFFVTIFTFITSSSIFFYIALALVIFLVFRYLWNRFF